ncbi:hypothetical protein Avbf_07974 [Armadillidium vulgare]|nr:hypothetical protein Avbf_07974 [Armadillidium vulgare]
MKAKSSKNKISCFEYAALVDGDQKEYQLFLSQVISKRFFVIPAGKSVEIPEAMYGNDDSFVAYFESHAFSFEIILSGKRRNVCEEEVPDQPNKYFVRKIIDYEVHMFPDDFEKEDILFFEDLAFMQYTLHNIGDADFYIQTLFFTPSLAPITFLVTGPPCLPSIKLGYCPNFHSNSMSNRLQHFSMLQLVIHQILNSKVDTRLN